MEGLKNVMMLNTFVVSELSDKGLMFSAFHVVLSHGQLSNLQYRAWSHRKDVPAGLAPASQNLLQLWKS